MGRPGVQVDAARAISRLCGTFPVWTKVVIRPKRFPLATTVRSAGTNEALESPPDLADPEVPADPEPAPTILNPRI